MIYLRALVELLTAGERASQGNAGALPIVEIEGGAELGRVFFTDGSLSWAESRLGGAPLVETLAELAGAPPDDFVKRCQQLLTEGRPLSEAFPMAARGLAAAIRPHVLRSLIALSARIAEGSARPVEFRPATSSLAAHFTFSNLALIDEAFASHRALRFGVAPEESRIVALAATVERSLAFVELPPGGAQPALPVAARGLDEFSLQSAFDLYDAALLASAQFAADDDEASPRLEAVLARQQGSGWLIVRESPYLAILRVGAAGEAGRLLGALGLLGRGEHRRVS